MTFVSLAAGSYRGTASSAVRTKKNLAFAAGRSSLQLQTGGEDDSQPWMKDGAPGPSGKCGACCLTLVPKKGLVPSHFGNSFRLNQIATSTGYNRLAHFATLAMRSTASFKSTEFLVRWTPSLFAQISGLDTTATFFLWCNEIQGVMQAI
jgi:hypothetical protein